MALLAVLIEPAVVLITCVRPSKPRRTARSRTSDGCCLLPILMTSSFRNDEASTTPGRITCMDGAYDMVIHVPVHYVAGTDATLDLAVTGDFRD